jgi:capsular polysaccharide biosynthesis protein
VAVSPLSAVLRHPLIAILPVVALVAAAVAVGKQRSPTYTAESRVAIGSFNPSQSEAPGAAYAGTQFAAAYSRAITAQDVVTPIARQTGLTAGQVAARIAATPIPDSPMVRITGQGPSSAEATKLTDAATSALLDYVRREDASGATANALLAQYRSAQAAAAKADNHVQDVQQRTNGQRPTGSVRRALDRAQTAADTADLRARALRSSYLQQAQSESSGIPVRTLNPAGAGTSDSSKTLKLLVTIAALVGVAVGVALATARATSKARKARGYRAA